MNRKRSASSALIRLGRLGSGTYVLWLRLPEAAGVTVGKLGPHHFAPGVYGYVGSAFGPGGLAARIGHHLARNRRTHWHLDYLRPHGAPVEIWCTDAAQRLEHRWASTLLAMRGATVPVAGFGAADCRCLTHLAGFAAVPSLQTFRRRLPPPRPTLYRLCLLPSEVDDPVI